MTSVSRPLKTHYINLSIPHSDPTLGWDKDRTVAHFRNHPPGVGDLVILQLSQRQYALTPITMVTEGKRRRIVTAAKPSQGDNDWLFSGKNNWGSPSIRLLPATKDTLDAILSASTKKLSIVWRNGRAFIDQEQIPLKEESEATEILQGFPRRLQVTENGKRLRIHLIRERRSATLKRQKIALLSGKPLVCEVCGINFQEVYALAEHFIEAHHRVPLSKTEEERVTTVEGISLLCSNCHRAIHIISPELQVEELAVKYRNIQSGKITKNFS